MINIIDLVEYWILPHSKQRMSINCEVQIRESGYTKLVVTGKRYNTRLSLRIRGLGLPFCPHWIKQNNRFIVHQPRWFLALSYGCWFHPSPWRNIRRKVDSDGGWYSFSSSASIKEREKNLTGSCQEAWGNPRKSPVWTSYHKSAVSLMRQALSYFVVVFVDTGNIRYIS